MTQQFHSQVYTQENWKGMLPGVIYLFTELLLILGDLRVCVCVWTYIFQSGENRMRSSKIYDMLDDGM